MIKLTRLNHKQFTLNALYIEQTEALPDTMITLTNGKKLVVQESVDDVTSKVFDFYKKASVVNVNPEQANS